PISRQPLILREPVRVAFGHSVTAVAEALLANLLRDTQRVHRRGIRVAKRVQAQRACPLLTHVAWSIVLSLLTSRSFGSIFGISSRSSRVFNFLTSMLLVSHGLTDCPPRSGIDRPDPTGQIFL